MWGKYSNQLQDLFTPSGGSELKLSLTLEVSQISKKEKKLYEFSHTYVQTSSKI